METVKVDIRKLQLLNDRISQCIDALNQVRLSTHGLSHTAGVVPGGPLAGFPQVQALGVGYSPLGQFPVAPGFVQGISHTAALGTPTAPAAFFSGPGAPYPVQVFGANPLAGLAGLAHTSPEMIEAYRGPIWADPLLATRVAQTFPYAQSVLPPVVSIY